VVAFVQRDGADFCAQLEAIDARHLHVEEDQVELLFRDRFSMRLADLLHWKL